MRIELVRFVVSLARESIGDLLVAGFEFEKPLPKKIQDEKSPPRNDKAPKQYSTRISVRPSSFFNRIRILAIGP